MKKTLKTPHKQAQVSDGLFVHFLQKKNKQGPRETKQHEKDLLYSKFSLLSPSACLSRFALLQNLGWMDHMISYQKAAAFPLSILLTL